jgi:type I restriction enzyme M protein
VRKYPGVTNLWESNKVTKDQVKANKYDLSASRYRQVEQDEEFYEQPHVTLKRLRQLE